MPLPQDPRDPNDDRNSNNADIQAYLRANNLEGATFDGTYVLREGPAQDPNKVYGTPASAPPPPSFSMPEFEVPDYEQQQQDYAAALAEQQAANERTLGINTRDELYANRLSATGSAIDFVNQQISEERSNARLLGIDYDITDDIKQERISNQFASVWGAGDESRLDELFKQWGKPQGFEAYEITRGVAAGEDETGAAANIDDVTVSTTGRRPTLIEEEEPLGGTTPLGVA